MDGELRVVTSTPVTKAMLKEAVRVLGGTWIDGHGRDEGVLMSGSDSARVRYIGGPPVAPAGDASGAQAPVAIVEPVRGEDVEEVVEWVARKLARRWRGAVQGAAALSVAPPFTYFAGPVSEMSGVAEAGATCVFCGGGGLCFGLSAAGSDLPEHERQGEAGCAACLKAGRFEFEHELDVGALTVSGLVIARPEPGIESGPQVPRVPADAQQELRRTPGFVTWQGDRWLTHCDDFMVYLGAWTPADFDDHAPGGDGRGLFVQMTADDPLSVWDSVAGLPASQRAAWPCGYYAFRCRHCGLLRGYYDFP